MMKSMTKAERGTLEWVNKIRRSCGQKTLKRLPPGIREDAAACPVARALDFGDGAEADSERVLLVGVLDNLTFKRLAAVEKQVGVGNICAVEDDSVSIIPPSIVDQFISEFDAGEIPALNEALVGRRD